MPESPSYQRLFAELKRRNVFRIAAVYGADPRMQRLMHALGLPNGYDPAADIFELDGR
jgi:hypothetical protein